MPETSKLSFDKWLRSEVAAAFAVGSFVAGMIIYITSPVNALDVKLAVLQAQVDNMKNNDLTHILQEQTRTAARIDEVQKSLQENTKAIIEMSVLLRQEQAR